MPLVLITDANVWIDLQVGGVLVDAVRLDYELVLPDVVHAEMEHGRPEVFAELGLLVELGHVRLGTCGPEGVALVQQLAGTYLKAQTPDLFALAMAKLTPAILVTGDRHLRQAAEAERVEVHGTLWLLEEMVAQSVVTARGAGDALAVMMGADRRLPEKECGRLIRLWRPE